VDGSITSYKALNAALELAQRIGSEVNVLHVMENVPKLYIESQKLLEQLLAARTDEGKKILDKCILEAKNNGVTVKTELQEGDPASVILELSKRDRYDTIVIGTRGLGRFKGLILGSVSSKVVHHSACSILLVR
jgi:nucleotide-binding universal stress UspA family protein